MNSVKVNFISDVEVLYISQMVADFISKTLGPNGKYIVVGNDKNVHTTKDGVSCMNMIKSNDVYINNIISIIKESSMNVLREAGDGTTSTVILANEMLKLLKSNDTKVTEQMLIDKIKDMIDKVDDLKVDVDDNIVKQIIETSVAGDKTLSSVIFDAYKNSINGTNIVTKTTIGSETKNEIIDGFFVNAKVASDTFRITTPIINPYVVVYAGTIETEREVIEFIDKLLEKNIKEVVILSNGISEDALAAMAINHVQGIIKILPVVISGGGVVSNIDLLKIIQKGLDCDISGQDLSMYLSDTKINKKDNIEKVYIDNNNIVFEGVVSDIDKTKELLIYKDKLNKATNDTEAEIYSYIISILESKMSVINIGSNIENKLKELKDRVDDAISSIRTSIVHGAVDGAGKTYIELNNKTKYATEFSECFSSIYTKINSTNVNANPKDSALVVKSVLKTSSDLALLLNNIGGIIAV